MSGSDKSALEAVADQAKSGISTERTQPAREMLHDGAGDLDLFGRELALFEGATIKPVAKGPGRPPGSPNRTTLQLQKLLLAKGYRDPAEFLASIYTMDTKALAKTLDCDAVDALKVQVAAAGDTMPYFHQKMPLAVEVKEDAPRRLIVMGDVVAQKIEHNQSLSVQAPKGSQASGSHDEG